jgi:hypothetical protein
LPAPDGHSKWQTAGRRSIHRNDRGGVDITGAVMEVLQRPAISGGGY